MGFYVDPTRLSNDETCLERPTDHFMRLAVKPRLPSRSPRRLAMEQSAKADFAQVRALLDAASPHPNSSLQLPGGIDLSKASKTC